MAVRVGINGFGRIGRQALKALLDRHPGDVEARASSFVVDGREIQVVAERDPGAIPWKKLGAQIVIESTGFFTDATKARAHIDAGAAKVIISAPAKNEDITIVLGVNQDRFDVSKHNVISNASCTTNGLAPVAKVLYDRFGIQRGLLTTVHSYTNSQRLLDVAAKDLRDARAAALNIVPAETGAARAVGLVIPELQGRFGGMSFRVPTSTVSVVDFTAVLDRDVSKDEINAAMREYSKDSMAGILGVTDEPLVSTDFKGDTR